MRALAYCAQHPNVQQLDPYGKGQANKEEENEEAEQGKEETKKVRDVGLQFTSHGVHGSHGHVAAAGPAQPLSFRQVSARFPPEASGIPRSPVRAFLMPRQPAYPPLK